MSKSEYKSGDHVVLGDSSTATVIAYAKGWYELDNGKKVRAKAISGLAEDEDRNLSSTMKEYRSKYNKTTGHNGLPTMNNGDDLAEALLKLSPDQVVDLAEQVLGLDSGELWQKYEHLNPGQRRMCSGNRIRAAIKKGDLTVKDVTKHIS